MKSITTRFGMLTAPFAIEPRQEPLMKRPENRHICDASATVLVVDDTAFTLMLVRNSTNSTSMLSSQSQSMCVCWQRNRWSFSRLLKSRLARRLPKSKANRLKLPHDKDGTMLVLSRKTGERIHLGDDVVITITKIAGNRVAIGIEAPREVSIRRGELCNTSISTHPVSCA